MLRQILEALPPLTLLALGGLFSEQAGVLNIALEGAFLGGAFTAILILLLTGNSFVAIGATLIVGLTLGALMALTILVLRCNLFIVGLGINLLAPTLASLITQSLYGHKGIIRLSNSPPPEPVFLTLGFTVWGTLLATGLASYVLYNTDYGRQLRVAGERPRFLVERSISPKWIKMTALLLSSGMAALTGAILAFRVGAWVPGFSAGRGWIALVMIWLGFRNPLGILGASVIFAFAEALAQRAQGVLNLPETLLLAVPYLIALLALVRGTERKG